MGKNPQIEAHEEEKESLKIYNEGGGEVHTLFESDDGAKAYVEAARRLIKKSAPLPLIESLLLEGWNTFSKHQLEEEQYVYKARIAHELAYINLYLGNMAHAFRWALQAFLDSTLGCGPLDGHIAGETYLRARFGFSDKDIESLRAKAIKCREQVSAIEDGWAQPIGFAEESLRELIEEQPSLFMRWATSTREFSLTQAYFQSLRSRIDATQNSKNSKEKGEVLEALAFYLLSLVPGCIPRRNLKDIQLVDETDVVVNNMSQTSSVAVDLLGRHFIVECKNWNKRVRVPQVGYFLLRMQLHHVKFGIMFAKKGITGKKKRNAAYELIRRAYHENGSLCVVIDKDDIDELIESKSSFWELLLEKIEEFRFGRPKKSKEQALESDNRAGADRPAPGRPGGQPQETP